MWEYKQEGEKMKYYSKEYYKNIMNTGVRNTGVKHKYDITDSINSLGNFFLTDEEKSEDEEELYNEYNEYNEYISNTYNTAKNTIEYVVDKELNFFQEYELDKYIDDYMMLDNYVNPNDINLKLCIKNVRIKKFNIRTSIKN